MTDRYGRDPDYYDEYEEEPVNGCMTGLLVVIGTMAIAATVLYFGWHIIRWAF